MLLISAFFIVGIAILLLSTKTFTLLAKELSSVLGLSPLFIGVTIVAIGTSLPELSISLTASATNDYPLAIGNIIGSNIVNMLLVFAAGVMIGSMRIGTKTTMKNGVLLLLVTVMYTISQYIAFAPSRIIGCILIISALLSICVQYYWARQGKSVEKTKFKQNKQNKFTIQKSIILSLSTLGIIIGGSITVISSEAISILTGISTGILGLTLTAIATSLPELLTTIVSQKQNESKLAIGNIIGSNIYNLLLIGGIISLFSNHSQTFQGNILFLNAITVLFVLTLLIFKGKIIPRWVGIFYIIFFFIYITAQTT